MRMSLASFHALSIDPVQAGCAKRLIACWRYERISGRQTSWCSREEDHVATTFPVQEGTVPFRGHETWYRIVGDSDAPGNFPLVCLHGGPGAAHDYLESLQAMAETGRRVIFYDQLGCGRSSIPESKPEMWTVELYVDELNAVRSTLGLDRIHLLGQSWGGMLGMEYALTQPPGLESLTIASSPASMIQWVEEANRLRQDLPPHVQQTLLHHEAAETF